MDSSSRMVPLFLLALAGCGGGNGAGATPPKAAPGPDAAAAADSAPAKTQAASKPVIDSSLIPEPGQALLRESFSYTGGNRDPFASLLDGKSIGPELSDLDLVGVMYDERDSRGSTAVVRDRASGKQYTIREGDRLGRARVGTIGARTVTFTVDDFGTQRDVTLSLRKREDVP